MWPIRQLAPAEFPGSLEHISDPPKTLYLAGSLPPPGTRYLAVIGSRDHSEYAKRMTGQLIAGLSGLPVSIVSGLARGIDGIAHEAALKAGLHTIAIPGSGLDPRVIYPRRHLTLAEEIVRSGGALISEERPLTTPKPYLFPKRNRIMAGMSDAVLVIEAKERSGTLITARLAVDYNRDVLVLTHDAESSGGIGCHRLIRDGAVPIREISDLIEAMSLDRV